MATASAQPADERVRQRRASRASCSTGRSLAPWPERSSSGSSSPSWPATAASSPSTGTATYLEVAAQVGIVGSAVALLMIAGEFDLSVGSMVGAAGMIVAIGIGEFGWPVWLAIVAAFAFALLIGFINGYIVVRTRLPSFIVTLGTLFILRGVTIGMTRTITGRTQVGGLGAATAGDPLAAIFTTDIGPVQRRDPVVARPRARRDLHPPAHAASATGSSAPAARRSRPATSACRSSG